MKGCLAAAAVAIALCGMTLWNPGAEAAPRKGLGLYAGSASHTSTVTAFSDSFDSSGTSIGVDYQVPMGENVSLNPFFMSSVESASHPGLGGDASVAHGILGFQLRYWIADALFLGAHLASYSEVITNETTNESSAGQGFGYGIALGYEHELTEKGSLFFNYQSDSASGVSTFDNSNVDLSGTRIHIGFRIVM